MVIEVGEVVVGDHMVKAGLVGIAVKTKVLVQLCIMKGVNYLSRGIFLLLIGRALCLLLMSLRILICLIPLLIVYKTMTSRKLSWTIQKRFSFEPHDITYSGTSKVSNRGKVLHMYSIYT